MKRVKRRRSRFTTIRRDRNEPSIIQAYERYGATVWRLASFNHKGLPDLWVNPPNGPGFFVEIKTATGTISEAQSKFKEHTPVQVVRTPKEARKTVGKTSKSSRVLDRTDSHLKTRIRLSHRKHRSRKRAIRKWLEEGAEVWFLQLVDPGLPHFWVKPRNRSGFFAHIGGFGKTHHEQRFATLNAVFEDKSIPTRRRKRKKRKRQAERAGCCCLLPLLSAGAALLVSAALLLGNLFLA